MDRHLALAVAVSIGFLFLLLFVLDIIGMAREVEKRAKTDFVTDPSAGDCYVSTNSGSRYLWCLKSSGGGVMYMTCYRATNVDCEEVP